MNMKKIISTLIAVAMILGSMGLIAMADTTESGWFCAFVSNQRMDIWGEIYDATADDSLRIEIYSAEGELMVTSRLAEPGYLGYSTLTWSAAMKDTQGGAWETTWEEGHPVDNVPAKTAKLFVDDVLVDTKAVGYEGPDDIHAREWIQLDGVKIASRGQVAYRGYILDGTREAIQLDLFDVYAASELTIELWNGETKLASSTYAGSYPLDKREVKLGNKAYLTSAIDITNNNAFPSWDTEWYVQPDAYNAPDVAKVFADGNEVHSFSHTSGNILDDKLKDYVVLDNLEKIAEVGGTGYNTLEQAIEAAADGETIKLLKDIAQKDGIVIADKNLTIDLNGNTITVSEGNNTNNRNFLIKGSSVVTIKNGTLVAAGEYSSGTYGTIRTQGTADVTLNGLKLYNYRGNGLNIKGLSGTKIAIADTEIYSVYGGGIEAAGAEIVLNNVTVDQKGLYTAPYNSMAISVNGGGKVTVNSGSYTTEPLEASDAYNQGTSHGSWAAGVLNSGGTLVINGGTFTNGNYGDNSLATAARGLILADTGAVIEINGGKFKALKSIVDIQNNLGIASKNPTGTIKGGLFSADPTNNYVTLADNFEVSESGVTGYPFVVNEEKNSDEIDLEFEELTTKEGEKLYNINLIAGDGLINRLNSVDLTFKLSQGSWGKNVYEIIASNEEVVINNVSEGRYEFHYNGKDGVKTDCGYKITIGQVKITGYGKFTFTADSTATTNAAHATTSVDNIVDTFVPGGVLDGVTVGEFDITDDTITDAEIKVPTRDLVIKLAFNNSVKRNAADYQQMKVIISGGDLANDIVIPVMNGGIDTHHYDITGESGKADAEYYYNHVISETENHVIVANALTVNTTYNVKVEGAGYRDAYYTVTMNEDVQSKTLNFWNNVKDVAEEVEVNKPSSAKNVTFLAGDIVKDNIINIYDLSAVVSYFGEEKLVETNNTGYAKYDLNRDGKIDSKDVAYVLVSWNK